MSRNFASGPDRQFVISRSPVRVWPAAPSFQWVSGFGARLTTTVVEFDLAVTAKSSSSKGGEVGIRVLGAELGGKGGAETLTRTVSRIAFGAYVQISPPSGD